MYDLEELACVNTCSPGKVTIQDVYLHNISLCRSLDYYVDPTSTQVLELGTKENPYRNIGLVFLEILNIHSHTDRNITINLKESTLIYMNQLRSYIINVTNVEIRSYSESVNNVPRSAEIYVSNFNIPYFSPKTRFNIISNTTMRLAQNLNRPNYVEREKDIISMTDMGIIVNRANLKIDNVIVSRDVVEDRSKTTFFIRAVYLQSKLLPSNIQLL